MKANRRIGIVAPTRTPFAQISKGLSKYKGHDLGLLVGKEVIKRSGIDPKNIDGVIVGEAFSSAPNAARVIANLLGLPDSIPAVTLANNCVSGLEATADAMRRVELGEGKVYLVIGEESQTAMPFVFNNARANKKTNSLDSLKKLSNSDLPEGVEIRDMLEDGLGDSLTSSAMMATAEILAQNYNLPRKKLDSFAYQSYKRAFDSSQEGKYKPFLFPVENADGEIMEIDESVLLREGIVKNPSRMDRAMLLYENPQSHFTDFKEKYGKHLTNIQEPTTSIFNASARSDGAAGYLVVDVEAAKPLGLQVRAELKGFLMKGVNPNLMGLGQAEASIGLLQELNLKIEDIDKIEIHEAFAATAVAALEEIKKRTGWEWEKPFEDKKINPNGGSIAIGHPFGATGARLLINAIMDFEESENVKKVLTTACAHGGVAGAMVLERYKD